MPFDVAAAPCDVAIECSGQKSAMEAALGQLSRGGTLVWRISEAYGRNDSEEIRRLVRLGAGASLALFAVLWPLAWFLKEPLVELRRHRLGEVGEPLTSLLHDRRQPLAGVLDHRCEPLAGIVHHRGDPRAGVWKLQRRNGLADVTIVPGQRLALPR